MKNCQSEDKIRTAAEAVVIASDAALPACANTHDKITRHLVFELITAVDKLAKALEFSQPKL